MDDILKIRNYQIIKKGDITFRPGITLITGPSNNGKSSIFKAYKQLIYNTSGNTYINQFADKCTLTLSNDKYSIEYNKTKTKSNYEIIEYAGELGNVTNIDKLGVNQIDKVKEITHIDKDLGYNFWDQLEKPFLISETNREQFLLLQESPISGNLINIQDNIKSDIKALKDSLLVSQGSLNVLTEDINKYENILKYSGDVNTIAEKVKDLNNTSNKIDKLTADLYKLENAKAELDQISKVADITITDNLKELFDKYNYFSTQINNIAVVNSQIVSWNQSIDNTVKEIEKLDNIINTQFNICPLCGNLLPHNE